MVWQDLQVHNIEWFLDTPSLLSERQGIDINDMQLYDCHESQRTSLDATKKLSPFLTQQLSDQIRMTLKSTKQQICYDKIRALQGKQDLGLMWQRRMLKILIAQIPLKASGFSYVPVPPHQQPTCSHLSPCHSLTESSFLGRHTGQFLSLPILLSQPPANPARRAELQHNLAEHVLCLRRNFQTWSGYSKKSQPTLLGLDSETE